MNDKLKKKTMTSFGQGGLHTIYIIVLNLDRTKKIDVINVWFPKWKVDSTELGVFNVGAT